MENGQLTLNWNSTDDTKSKPDTGEELIRNRNIYITELSKRIRTNNKQHIADKESARLLLPIPEK